MGTLATTNLLLGIMAAVSLLEGLLIIAVAVTAWRISRRVMDLVTGLEQRHVAPAMARVNAILDDVQAVSTMVKSETVRVDNAIHTTMNRVDDTAHRVRTSIRARTSRIVGLVRGVRTAVEHFTHARHEAAAGRTQSAYHV